jgi:[ribosomal protein S5]-alanine N-acetyltransferase
MRPRGPSTFQRMVVSTPRLDLVELPPAVLRLIELGDRAAVGRALAAPVPDGWMEDIPARMRLDQLAADPAEQPWLVRAALSRADGRVVGSAGFHAPPGADGRVEVGYSVVPAERRRGYAREALLGLAGWAHATGRARILVASISPGNAPSLALARSLGLRQVGEHIDEEDGLEHVFERALPLEPVSGG